MDQGQDSLSSDGKPDFPDDTLKGEKKKTKQKETKTANNFINV